MKVFSKARIFFVMNVLLIFLATAPSANAAPKLLSPTLGSTLSGSSATFTWTANGAAVTNWTLRAGTSPGDASFFNSGNLSSSTLARTASGLPTNGTTVWVRLQWRLTNGTWSSTDAQYTTGAGSSSTTSSTTSTNTTSTTTSNGGNASVYYVATNGNDGNAGTQSAPFRTLQFAISRGLLPGDTLFIRGGIYSEKLQSWAGTSFPSGTSWSTPVKITAFNGETVVLKGLIDISLASPAIQYLIFEGIHIDALNRQTGISINGNAHHIRFQNGEVKNANEWGVAVNYHNAPTFGDTFHEFIKMNVHHNGTTNNVDHGFYIKTSRNLIDSCNIHDNAAWGIHNFAGSSAEPKANNNTYRNNLIHHNGIVFNQGGGITFGSGNNNIAYNNVVWKNHTGIVVHNYRNPVNTGVFHNTIYDNQGFGILIESGSQDTRVLNNISYKNQTNLKNQGTKTTTGHNLTTNPSFKNSSFGDFHLQSGSAAIDTGTPISIISIDHDRRRRPQGNQVDIGAYEW